MKTVIFIIMLPFILPMVLFILFIIKVLAKTEQDEWKGTIVDKIHNQKRDIDKPHRMQHFYSVVVNTTDGKTRKVAVSAMEYEKFNIGDTMEKTKGTLKPKVVTKKDDKKDTNQETNESWQSTNWNTSNETKETETASKN